MTTTANLSEGVWINRPSELTVDAVALRFTTHTSTDFWSRTHYGFVRNNGHFLGVEVEGDFTATVQVHGDYRDKYDQAGLMIRVNADNWLKCGIEYVDGVAYLSAVATTSGFSDWSVAPSPMPEWLGIRLIRVGDSVSVEFAPDGVEWRLARLAYLVPSATVAVGPMACSPDGAGFKVQFREFTIGAAEEQPH
jgi:regulation of enolase protein 1 (concanavalin A-like superfamily)